MQTTNHFYSLSILPIYQINYLYAYSFQLENKMKAIPIQRARAMHGISGGMVWRSHVHLLGTSNLHPLLPLME